jgi:hypothetical protein
MSEEKNLDTGIKNLPHLETSQKGKEVISSGRVDINILLKRANREKKKDTRENLVFAGLLVCLIFVAGLILSF